MLNKRQSQTIRGLVQEYVRESKRNIKEDFGRGLPDFIVAEVAKDTADEMKRHLMRHINSVAQNPRHKREMLAELAPLLREIEADVTTTLREKLEGFIKGF